MFRVSWRPPAFSDVCDVHRRKDSRTMNSLDSIHWRARVDKEERAFLAKRDVHEAGAQKVSRRGRKERGTAKSNSLARLPEDLRAITSFGNAAERTMINARPGETACGGRGQTQSAAELRFVRDTEEAPWHPQQRIHVYRPVFVMAGTAPAAGDAALGSWAKPPAGVATNKDNAVSPDMRPATAR
ncbi:unnamed protein product [Prorocentrum cordatum]|uniref:Uncharacterized protein n=1 Tax=Prorocentrum cordatum TaxID=2364126 RepID=A0ABN9X027_9DINO|nr:unnamed protein product [Polarella glacialis]